jgi:hypothetical protein
MNQNVLTYDGIQSVLLDRFPELSQRVERTFGSYYDLANELPDAFPVFEDVFQEWLFELLDADKNDSFAKARAFSFLEEMASSEDKKVINLLWISILEPLVLNRERLARAAGCMGQRTRQLAREAARVQGPSKTPP